MSSDEPTSHPCLILNRDNRLWSEIQTACQGLGSKRSAARDRVHTVHFLGLGRMSTPPRPESVPLAMRRLLNIIGDTLRV